MVNYKSKYLKYKLKYQKITGGMDEKKKMAFLISLIKSDNSILNDTAKLIDNLTVTIFVDGKPYVVSKDEKLTKTMLDKLTETRRNLIYEVNEYDMDRFYAHQKMTPEEKELSDKIQFGQTFVGFQDYPRDGLSLKSICTAGRWIRGKISPVLGRVPLIPRLIYGISDAE